MPPTASTLSPRLAYVSRNSTPEITLVTPRDRSLATAAALESSAPFEFLRGEGAELLADELRAGGLAYLREEALCDVELRTRFPNPFCLVPVSTSQAPRLRRYLTASAQAVTLWLDGAACEVVPLDDWRRHFRSFARVAAAPPLYRCHRRRFFVGWRAAVRRARNTRNAQALLRAFREAQAELERRGAPAVTARALGPALEAVRQTAGWARAQAMLPQQLGWGKERTLQVGPANGAHLAEELRLQLHRVGAALLAAFETLQEALEATALQPILAPTPSAMQACCFLLEKYGRHNYAAVANSHMNRPPLLQAVEGPRRRVGVAQLPRSRPLRGAKLKELERWSEPYKRVGFEHAARAITAAHMVPAARLVRLADHMVLGALLRLPVEAVRYG